MTLHNPVVPRAADDKKARPERMFEMRRGVWIILLVMVVLCIGFFIVRGCLSPFSGSEKIMASGNRQLATATVVPVVLPIPVTVTPVAFGPVSALPCYMLSDVPFVGGTLPVNSRVMVNGYTFAQGGRVFVSDPNAGWIDAGLVKCSGQLGSLERSYFVTSTPTALPSATLPRQTNTPVKIFVNAPTHTPYPTYTPYPVLSSSGLGVYRESGNCWRFDISGVREIRVNRGDPVSGGSVVCGVKSFTVVVE